MSYVAFQYAEALFAIAHEEKNVEAVLNDFTNFVNSLDEDIYKFLNHPKVSKKDKKSVIEKTITNSLFKNFVFVLIDNSRIEFLSDCLNEFKVIVDDQNKVMNVVVYSGKELSEQELKDLQDNLKKKHNRKVKLENVVDNTIIGGIRLEFEGMIFDETVNSYLQTLQNNLTK